MSKAWCAELAIPIIRLSCENDNFVQNVLVESLPLNGRPSTLVFNEIPKCCRDVLSWLKNITPSLPSE